VQNTLATSVVAVNLENGCLNINSVTVTQKTTFQNYKTVMFWHFTTVALRNLNLTYRWACSWNISHSHRVGFRLVLASSVWMSILIFIVGGIDVATWADPQTFTPKQSTTLVWNNLLYVLLEFRQLPFKSYRIEVSKTKNAIKCQDNKNELTNQYDKLLQIFNHKAAVKRGILRCLLLTRSLDRVLTELCVIALIVW